MVGYGGSGTDRRDGCGGVGAGAHLGCRRSVIDVRSSRGCRSLDINDAILSWVSQSLDMDTAGLTSTSNLDMDIAALTIDGALLTWMRRCRGRFGACLRAARPSSAPSAAFSTRARSWR
eukprot:1403526-Rhodomonas_salina.1